MIFFGGGGHLRRRITLSEKKEKLSRNQHLFSLSPSSSSSAAAIMKLTHPSTHTQREREKKNFKNPLLTLFILSAGIKKREREREREKRGKKKWEFPLLLLLQLVRARALWVAVGEAMKKSKPNQQRTLDRHPTELRRRKFFNEHPLSLQIGAKRAKKVCVTCIYIFWTELLPFRVPQLVVGKDTNMLQNTSTVTQDRQDAWSA